MKKILSVLAVTMCGAALMLSACGNGGGDDSTKEVELTEVTVTEAYETLSTFSEKYQSAFEADSFNITVKYDITNVASTTYGEEVTESVTSYDIDAKCLYDGEHFYGDIDCKYMDTDYYTYSKYRDTQMVFTRDETEMSQENEVRLKGTSSYESIEQSINSYFWDSDNGTGTCFSSFMTDLQELQVRYEGFAEYEDVDVQLTVKMYSEADYIKIAAEYTMSWEGYTSSREMNIEVNIAAGLTADDFEPISAE